MERKKKKKKKRRAESPVDDERRSEIGSTQQSEHAECVEKQSVRQKLDDAWYEERCSIVRTQGSDSSEEQYKCKNCDYVGATRKRFYAHWRHGHEKSWECDQCAFKTSRPSELEKHRLLNHDANLEDSLKLKKIAFRFSRVNGGMIRFKQCNKLFVGVNQLKVHWINFHKKQIQCEHCSFATADPSSLKRHQAAVHEKKAFKCDICARFYSTKAYLSRHYAISHNLDEKVVLAKNNIKKECQDDHVSFKCGLCKYRSGTKRSILNHMRVHEEGSKFVNAFDKKNLKIIHGVYRCKKCEGEYKTSHLFRNHFMTVHSQSFKCQWCGSEFGRSDKLKKHLLEHN